MHEDNSPTSQSPATHNKARRMNVRTGCRTCKLRRVKCDETKPFCTNCTKFSRTCGGYEPNVQNQASLRQAHVKSALSLRKGPFIPKNPVIQSFTTDSEHAYFRLFCEKTSITLAGDLDAPLWNRIILQACELEPALRHAVIALGAIDKTDETRRLMYTSGQPLAADTHHTVALQQYAKSVAGMRKSIANGDMDIRKILIGCLLTVCFECFHGNTQSAISLVKSGLKLINNASQSPRDSLSPSTSFESPAIEDEIMVAFNRLDINSVSFISGPPVRVGDASIHSSLHTLSTMPDRFADFDAARQSMELLFRVAIHWITHQHTPSDGSAEPIWDDRLNGDDTRKTVIMWTDHQHTVPSWDRFLLFMHRWWESVQHLFVWARSPEGHKHLNIAIVLEMRFRTAYIAFMTIKGETIAHDDDLLDSSALLDRAESLHARRKAQRPVVESSFVFDGPFIGALHIVTQRTRDPTVRRRAIALLECKPRREGLWDSRMIAKLARLCLEIEEKEQQDGIIPLHARIQALRCTFDLQQTKGVLQYRRRKEHPQLGYVHAAVEFTW